MPSAMTSALEQHLLSTLIVFINHVVKPLSRAPNLSSTKSQDITHRQDDTQGQLLIGALKNIIRAEISAKEDEERAISDNETELVDVNSQTQTTSKPVHGATAIAQMPTPEIAPEITPRRKIPTWALDQMRQRVFSRMPIRLLSFASSDANGSPAPPKLIGRNDVLLQLQHAYLHQLTTGRAFILLRRQGSMANFLAHHARYAILSHTWIRDTPGDVVYPDLVRGWAPDSNPGGYAKIEKFCEVAAQIHGLKLGWMDTVCINKDSSSELDESIRSMYKWYRQAEVCVVYLSETRSVDEMHSDSWLRRGWTLQELLASRNTVFYDKDWRSLIDSDVDHDPSAVPPSALSDPNSPSDTTSKIQKQITLGTDITPAELDLCKQGKISRIPISRRLYWALRRTVTREEDTAYSLMGILGVDISIAYGEGSQRALFRLIRELLSSQPNILDLFNCGLENDLASDWPTAIIPSKLSLYRFRSTVFDLPPDAEPHRRHASVLDRWQPIEPIILTHLGVRIPLLLVPALISKEDNTGVNVDVNSTGPPIGDFHGVAQLYRWSGSKYDLLHRRIFTDDGLINRTHNESEGYLPTIVTFGILNFGMDRNDIVLPGHCLPIPLDCGTIYAGDVSPSDRVKVVALDRPVVFQLKSSTQVDRVAKGDLKTHGFQLITMYL